VNSLRVVGVELAIRREFFAVPRHFGLKSKSSITKTPSSRRSNANDLEGRQDMGGKHGGQAGEPKPPKAPRATKRDSDVAPRRSEPDPSR
jgi:hypothetical protein